MLHFVRIVKPTPGYCVGQLIKTSSPGAADYFVNFARVGVYCDSSGEPLGESHEQRKPIEPTESDSPQTDAAANLGTDSRHARGRKKTSKARKSN